MSLIRWGEEGSNVYVIHDVNWDPPNDYHCVGCDDAGGLSKAELIDHLKKHREEGHVVPDSLFRDLEDD